MYDDYDDEYDDEYDQPWDDDSPEETVPCSHCGEDVYEDAVQCPACGSYITRSSSSVYEGKPIWWILLGVIGTVATILALTVG